MGPSLHLLKSPMRISALTIYPVKALRPLSLTASPVDQCGLQHDRRWAILRPGGRVLTQRDLPAMATIDAYPDGAALRLEAAHRGGVTAFPNGPSLTLEVWRTQVAARAANPEASAWLTQTLGATCTLAYLENPAARPVTPDLARPGDVVSLADGFPLLITTTASLANLNRRLDAPVPMDRFRPNLVLDTAIPWQEDTWSHIDAGPIRLRLASPCARCKVVTLDQQTGAPTPGQDPLRTLATFRRSPSGQITFGLNAIPETFGTLALGTPVTARQAERQPPPGSA